VVSISTVRDIPTASGLGQAAPPAWLQAEPDAATDADMTKAKPSAARIVRASSTTTHRGPEGPKNCGSAAWNAAAGVESTKW
jgi:hypothetical protein